MVAPYASVVPCLNWEEPVATTYLTGGLTNHRSIRGADDPTLTGHAGLLLVRDLNSKLQLVARLDSAIERVRRFKCRRRGLSGGQMLVCLVESILAGGSHLAQRDPLREMGPAGRCEPWRR